MMLTEMNPTLARRFWDYVIKPTDEDTCWDWIGPIDSGGYGRLSIDSKGTYVHSSRISYEIYTNQEVPIEVMVLHHCDNRRCNNPKHLYLGTALDNARDRDSRGRSNNFRQGIAHPMAKLTEEDVKQIILLRREGLKLTAIASQFGITDKMVSAIANGKRWAHISV